MKEVYYLWEENNVPLFKKEYGQDIPNLTVYPIESDAAVPCVIVFPGGGYGHLAVDHEGRQICEFLNKNGFAAFMLCYRLAPYHFPCQELDAKRAVRFVRANAAPVEIQFYHITNCPIFQVDPTISCIAFFIKMS